MEEKTAPPPATVPEEILDRISVKDGTRIHIIPIKEIFYLQACGDYVTLFTTSGQHVKEQTMKYFERSLPSPEFVRIHRSYIVNTEQILRVELFGKETYQVRLRMEPIFVPVALAISYSKNVFPFSSPIKGT